MFSVIQTWVIGLPMRQQGVLVLALRGPDGIRKESSVKPIIRAMRACVMNCAFLEGAMPRNFHDDDDPFMSTLLISQPVAWSECCNLFFADMDEHNLHFIQHFAHAACILGYKQPDMLFRAGWELFYKKLTRKLHWHPETEEDIDWRLRDGKRAEDRIERLERRGLLLPPIDESRHTPEVIASLQKRAYDGNGSQ